MFWSRFWRICVLVGVWAAAAYVVSNSVLAFFRRRHGSMQNASALSSASLSIKERQLENKRTFLSPKTQRNALLVVVALLLLGVLGQTLFAAHVPLLNGLSLNNSANASGATFVTQAPAKAVTRTQTFETGIVTPQWQQQTAYGPQWQQSLSDIQTQTGARWIELSLLFSQATSTSTTVQTTQSTPLVSSFAAGVRAAHAKGLHVFVVPLMGVREVGGWAGSIHLSSQAQEQAWFDSYWNTYKPYVEAAAQEGADQMAIATECAWLQQNVPASMWNQLIDRIHSVFKGTLTYDTNWYPVNQAIPTWFENAHISMIGVSSYIPLIDVSKRVDPKDMIALWKQRVQSVLDTISAHCGKPVLISEIGYRDSADALYHSWEQNSNTPVDAAEQAGAYEAALENALSDKRIAGIFFWGWEDVGMFTLKGQSMTTAVLYKWYSSAS